MFIFHEASRVEELYRERAVIRSSNRTRVDRKTNRLSLALSLSPPTYNNSSSKNNNIRPVSRSLLVLDTRPSTNDGISVAAVAACYVNTRRWEIRRFQKVRSRMADTGRNRRGLFHLAPCLDRSLETCANFNVYPPEKSTGKDEKWSFELLKSFSLRVTTIFFLSSRWFYPLFTLLFYVLLLPSDTVDRGDHEAKQGKRTSFFRACSERVIAW